MAVPPIVAPLPGAQRIRLYVKSVKVNVDAARSTVSEFITFERDLTDPDAVNPTWFAGAGGASTFSIEITEPTMFNVFQLNDSYAFDVLFYP